VDRRQVTSGDSTATAVPKLTHSMMLVGTAAYMSPEQASGKAVDSRSDVWAFGCVLYEALAGQRAFGGATITEILATVLKEEPDWGALPIGTPPALQVLLKRCLRKDPNSRLRDIGDARIELEDGLATPESAVPQPGHATRRDAIAAIAGVAAGAAGTGIFAISRYRDGVPRGLTRFAIAVPGGGSFAPSFNRRIGISPDGRNVVFCPDTVRNAPGIGNSYAAITVYIRSLSDLEAKPLKEADNSASPFFSPDGRWLGLFTRVEGACGCAKWR
jgi:serine/threonine-protein kinase